MNAKSTVAPFYKLRITLNDTAPPIWREVVVRSGMTLDVLNEVIQIAMGWTNSHMHMLRVGEVQFGDPGGEFDFPIRDEARATIDEVARLASGGHPAVYEYDFGDGWEYDLRIEPLQDEPYLAKHKAVLAWCVGGARACPPEDCGGIGGYEELVEAMGDPDHPRHDELIEWLGGVFEPERFDLAEVNQELVKVRSWRGRDSRGRRSRPMSEPAHPRSCADRGRGRPEAEGRGRVPRLKTAAFDKPTGCDEMAGSWKPERRNAVPSARAPRSSRSHWLTYLWFTGSPAESRTAGR